MSITLIVGIIFGLMAALAAAFGYGHAKGSATQKAKNERQQAKEDVAAAQAIADRRINTVKEAQDVEQKNYCFA